MPLQTIKIYCPLFFFSTLFTPHVFILYFICFSEPVARTSFIWISTRYAQLCKVVILMINPVFETGAYFRLTIYCKHFLNPEFHICDFFFLLDFFGQHTIELNWATFFPWIISLTNQFLMMMIFYGAAKWTSTTLLTNLSTWKIWII